MEFRTSFKVSKSPCQISHKDQIMLFGSCFIENIGKKLINYKFNANLNPFGVLYNPISIKNAVELILANKKFEANDLIFHQGIYHSLHHHGCFSNIDRDKCLDKINEALDKAHSDLKNTDIIIITLGTSYVYTLNKSNEVVGNCHKLPATEFTRKKLSVEIICEEWGSLISSLKEINPKLKILFTISPIRHLRDGAHDNQLSKATLLLAVEKLVNEYSHTYYFPSYEIMLDDLRDYRFYAEDMIHPSEVAIKYIWEQFSSSSFDEETSQIMKEWDKIRTALEHRPINEQGVEHKHFLKQTMLRLNTFHEKYPYICVCKEIENLRNKLL